MFAEEGHELLVEGAAGVVLFLGLNVPANRCDLRLAHRKGRVALLETTDSGILGFLQRLLVAMLTTLRLAEALRRAWHLAQQATLTAPRQDLSCQLKSAVGDLRLPATLWRKDVQQYFGTRSQTLAAAFGLRSIRVRKISSNRIAPPATAPPCPTG
jgi:hypothetical protein